ncbi:MAG: YebC/PmpR family DNA-binding transcriptional regulator [Patescibacteria group bacterium]
MSGHSHWAGIKHKKEITDKKRGKIFSKLLKATTAAVGGEPNPDFNPRLRTAVQKAKEANVPVDTIERAIKRASESGSGFEELEIEAYSPGGAALLIEAIADNKNRVIAEVKKILSDHGAKWAEQGSVRWAFEKKDGGYAPKFGQDLSIEDGNKLKELVRALEEHDDVQNIYTNAKI